MENRFMLVVFICLIIGIKLNAQTLESPCPRIFKYNKPTYEYGKWSGVINLITDTDLNGIWLWIVLNNPALYLGNSFGRQTSTDKKEFVISNTDHILLANSSYPFRLTVEYDPKKPVPKLAKIRLNGKTICPDNGKIPTAVQSTTPITHLLGQGISTTESRPISLRYIVEFSSETPEEALIAPQCGRQSPIIVEPLILGGENSTEGEWPWLAAIYKTEIGTSKYICGGTLLTNSYIVTAAHCVSNLNTGDTERSNKFLIYTGITRINNISPNAQIGQVSQIKVFPEYTPENYHNDIAVIKMLRPFQYTDYVKPICLWKDDDELNKVVGTLGTVAGWGFDENQKVSTVLKKTRMPIVDSLKCVYSYPDFFGKFTSPRSFCAGFRNNSGVCNGDSGSGMVISKPDKDGQLTWHLRGLVSVSVRKRDTRQCDPSHYVVFTDVAKYTSWITKIIG